MKKLSTIFILWILAVSAYAQDSVYVSKQLSIKFFSKTSMENINAKSEKAVSGINLKSKDVFFRVSLTSFGFDNKLMEEHFNENYVESDKYPNSTFKGKITEMVATGTNTYNVKVLGKLIIHNVEKEYTIQGKMHIEKNQISLDSKFFIALVDHKIEIPSVLSMNLAEIVEVTVTGAYQLNTQKFVSTGN